MQTTHCCQGLSSASNTVDLIAAHAVHFGLARSLKTFLPQHRTAIVSRSARKQYQFACTRSQRCRAMVAASERVKIPARQGKALRLSKGQYIKVINTHGSQVVDTWAFKSDDLNEMMSMEHTRSAILSLLPKVGDVLVTNKRRPILTLVDDTSPGVHDTCMSACDIYRYRGLGCEGYHDSCTDNLYKGLKEIGLTPPECPSPFNLWMNVPMTAAQDGGKLHFAPPVSKAGDYVTLRAEMDCFVAFSACPQDMLPINGTLAKALLDPSERATIYDCHYEVLPNDAFPADLYPVKTSSYFLQS